MQKTPARIGIIGGGHWGRNYIRLFSSLPDATLAAVVDIDADTRTRVQSEAPGVPVYESHRACLEKGGCDAWIVATSAGTHYSIIKDALESGLDVLAEKPLTLSVDEAGELVRLAEDKNRILQVAHTFLFNPSVIQLKKYVDDGTLGDVYYIKARRTHLGLIREDVNAVWDLAPHDISMFLYLLGEMPESIQAVGRRILNPDREDVAFINLAFPSGVVANIHVSWADSNKERVIDLVGSNSRIVFDDLNIQEPLRIYHKGVSVNFDNVSSTFGEFKYLFRDGDIISPKIQVQEPLRVLCSAFVESLSTRKGHFSNGRFGMQVVQVLSEIDAALSSTSSLQKQMA